MILMKSQGIFINLLDILVKNWFGNVFSEGFRTIFDDWVVLMRWTIVLAPIGRGRPDSF